MEIEKHYSAVIDEGSCGYLKDGKLGENQLMKMKMLMKVLVVIGKKMAPKLGKLILFGSNLQVNLNPNPGPHLITKADLKEKIVNIIKKYQ